MTEVFHFLKDYWFLTLSVSGFVGSLLWVKLDARYMKREDVKELSQSIKDVEGRTKTLEDKIQHLPSAEKFQNMMITVAETSTQVKEVKHLVNLLVEKEMNKNEK
ncbi:MAG: DUF2730 family protein [Gammaproteobacteria bacterium]|nr:DUF2730 family protein [Gammaproteobacteria bacterium]